MISKTMKFLLNTALIVMFLAGATLAADKPRGYREDLDRVAKGIKVDIVKVVYQKPITKYLAGEQQKISQVVQFTVIAKENIQTGAIGPFLKVGRRVVFYFEIKKDNVFVYTEYAPEKLPQQGKVFFQWGGNSPKKEGYDTGAVFDKEKVKVINR